MSGPFAWLNEAGGTVRCELRGAEPEVFLNRCNQAGIPALDVRRESDDRLSFLIPLRNEAQAAALAQRSQCELAVLRRRGLRVLGRTLRRRLVPVIGLLLLLAVLLGSKCFIWEMEVIGCETVSAARVMNALSECGVGIGCFWPGFTGDNVRSELLVRMPELAWAAVNIRGSRAEVIVRERVPKPEIRNDREQTDLLAARTGFVTKVQTLCGTARVKPGSAVTAGELLIEGVTDSAFSGEREVHALGSVTAETFYEYSAVFPDECTVRTETGQPRSRWALEIGRTRINFYRNSSICSGTCDKIIKEWECKIRGLFSLPIRLIRERETPYKTGSMPRDGRRTRAEAEGVLYAALLDALGDAGSVERFSCSAGEGNGRLVICLRACCSEEIAAEHKRIQEGYQ